MFDTFASDDSSPFAVPSPLSQRACQRDPREHDPRPEATMAATVGQQQQKEHLSLFERMVIFEIFWFCRAE